MSRRGQKTQRRIAIVGAGISGLGAAWALSRHPDRFDFRLYEAQGRIGGNAVTACIPTIYHHVVLLMQQFGIDLVDTRFSYSVKYRGRVYAHDYDSELREQLHLEIAKFQRILRRLHWLSLIHI